MRLFVIAVASFFIAGFLFDVVTELKSISKSLEVIAHQSEQK